MGYSDPPPPPPRGGGGDGGGEGGLEHPISVLSARQPATFCLYADARYIDAVIVSQAMR